MTFAIVGAGVGGLATALRLAHRGHKVVIFEKTDQVGGRNRELVVGQATFDSGPTLMMMLDPFRKLFADVGERLEDHLDLVPCNPNYRVFFADDQQVDCTTDVAQMTRQIERLSGGRDAAAYPKMLDDLKSLYEESVPHFVERNYDSVLDLIKPKSLQIALRGRMLGNFAKGMARYYQDPRLRILFSLQTMYLGLSPYQAPFVYAVLVYMEYGGGIWYPKGGMVEISRSIARLAESKGASIRLNSPVKEIQGKTIYLESGESFAADAVIVNADLPYAEKALLPKSKPPRNRRYSCSAFMIYIDYEGKIPELLHHNILLGANFQENLDQLFELFEIPSDPAIYVAISSKTDPQRAAEGHENLFILVPCPNLTHPFGKQDVQELKEKAFQKLEKKTSFRREKIANIQTKDPRDWARELNLDRGAAFGLSHDLFQSVCFRPSNKSRDTAGVYFVGASTHPGNGLPMVLIGADLLEQRLVEDGLI